MDCFLSYATRKVAVGVAARLFQELPRTFFAPRHNSLALLILKAIDVFITYYYL